MTSRNLISAIFISLHLSVILVLLYVFFPLRFLMFGVILRGIFSHGPETNGIGGVSEWVVEMLIVAPILFVVVFMLLQKRRRID